MKIAVKLHKVFALFALTLLITSFFPKTNITAIAQSAPTEPNCQTVASTPTFNPYPISLTDPNPTYSPGSCRDIPLLSFFPINTGANNPREITVGQNQNISYQIYYNNGATPGSGAISNPIVKVMVTQTSPTKFCISATLSGSNTNTITSAAKGGDICVNTPGNTRLNIVGGSTVHFPDADERLYENETTGRSPSDSVPDNSSGANVSNPIYMSFPASQLTSTSGYSFKPSLEAGFLGYGYFLSQIVTTPIATQNTNLPPSVPGQEITIVRGDTGSFERIIGSDPDNNLPLTYMPNNLPSFCSYNSGNQIINCQSNAQTPVKSTFTVTPKDSKDLAGTPGTFIVNIIEPTDPNLSKSTKVCIAAKNSKPCNESELTKGDKVSYTINVQNTGGGIAKNVKVLDTYDKVRLSNIDNLLPKEGVLNKDAGTIDWNLEDIPVGNSKEVKFDAVITDKILNTETILNEALISADNLPNQKVSAIFPVIIPNSPALTANKTCKKQNTSTNCANAGLTQGSTISYEIKVTNNGQNDAYNVKVVDTYDLSRLEGISNIQPKGNHDTNKAEITWDVGTLKKGQSISLTFDAKIKTSVQNGDVIINKALITATDLPNQEVSTDFPVGIVLGQTPRSGGVTLFFLLLMIGLGGGSYYYYKKHNKLGKHFQPARSKESK
jgi:uncharacterized repeat protein (TIGR01451 family)